MNGVIVNEDAAIQQVAALRATAGTYIPVNDSAQPLRPLVDAILDAYEMVSKIDRPSLRETLKRQLRALAAERYQAPVAEAAKIKLAMLQDEPIAVEDPRVEPVSGRRPRRV